MSAFTWMAPVGFKLTAAGLRCPRCGSGFPCCADMNHMGEFMNHEDVCTPRIFRRFDVEVCEPCREAMGWSE